MRNSCDEISTLSEQIAEMVYGFVTQKINLETSIQFDEYTHQFDKNFESSEKAKDLHTFRLGPALANPKFRKELDELCASE